MPRILKVSRRWLAVPALAVLGACAAERVTNNDGSSTETIIAPNILPLSVGATQRLTARVTRGGADTIVVTDVTWSTEDPTVAVVTDGNLLTAVDEGTTWVVADRKGKRGRSQVRVTQASTAPVVTVVVDPASATILPGTSVTISAAPLDANGAPVTGRTLTWTSSNPGVATVSNGVVTGLQVGSVSVVASVDGIAATSAVTVQPPPVASVAVSLNSTSIAVLQQTTAAAVLRDGGGNVLTGRPVTWASSNPAVATVDAAGVVRAVAIGTTSISATSEGQSGSATLTVTAQRVATITLQPSTVTTPIGSSVQVTAVMRDGSGNEVTGRTPAWSSASTAIATVSASGTVTGVALGTTQVTATADGVNASAAVTVVPVGDAVPVVTPATASVQAGQTVQLSAQMRDAAGNVLPATFTWSSANTGVATVSASGLVTGVSAGTVSIVATADGRSASSSVTVTSVPVASVSVTPTSLALEVGRTGTLAAVCRDASGNALAGRTVTWSSSATGVATVSAVGGVVAVAPGTATVTATCESRTGTAAVTVTASPVASVTLSPATATVATGSTTQLTATLRDAAGNVLTGRPITWSSSNTAAATVNGNGLVTGIASGAATITATSEGRSGTSSITVSAPLPPPSGSTVYANEPTGMRYVIDAPFNTTSEGGWRPEPAHVDGRFGITTDASAPRSPSNVLDFVYPVGFTSGGYSPGTVRAPAPFPDATGVRNIREIFWAYHFKGSPGFQNHASNVNKLGYGWLNDATTFGIVWHWGRTQRPAQDYMKQMAIFVSGSYFMFNTAEAINVEPGAWYKVEVHFRPSSGSGVADGFVRVWVNGILCANHQNVTTTAGFISDVYWSPTWGGMGGSNKLQEDYVRFDHTRISVR